MPWAQARWKGKKAKTLTTFFFDNRDKNKAPGKRVKFMITEAEEREILDQAYIPEHIVSLMKNLSGGEPFLIDGFLFFFKKDWLIVIGYPLGSSYQPESLEKAILRGLEKFHPAHAWFMAPEAPPLFSRLCSNRQRDEYYELDLRHPAPSEKLVRIAEKASRELRVTPGPCDSRTKTGSGGGHCRSQAVVTHESARS
jgi:hypothetical protein